MCYNGGSGSRGRLEIVISFEGIRLGLASENAGSQFPRGERAGCAGRQTDVLIFITHPRTVENHPHVSRISCQLNLRLIGRVPKQAPNKTCWHFNWYSNVWHVLSSCASRLRPTCACDRPRLEIYRVRRHIIDWP
jgi:hypothetical protein